MFGRNNAQRQRRRTAREDRRFLEARVRRFLSAYLSATEVEKSRFYEAVAGASDGCQPQHSSSSFDNLKVAWMAAGLANDVVRRRVESGKSGNDRLETFITDAYATATVAYRRAAGIYVDDSQMQKLGTAAVHLLTIAKSAMASATENVADGGQ